MHIPDGFLNAPTLGAGLVVSGTVLAHSIQRVNRTISESEIPTMGLLAAVIFSVQLFSIPVVGGTSTHLNGALLAALLLGPRKAFIVMCAALLALALIFQHGGLLSIGINVVNIALIGTFGGYALVRLLGRNPVSILLTAWFTAALAASLCALELAGSGMLTLKEGLLPLLSVHSITGILEGIITWFALSFIERVRPQLLEHLG